MHVEVVGRDVRHDGDIRRAVSIDHELEGAELHDGQMPSGVISAACGSSGAPMLPPIQTRCPACFKDLCDERGGGGLAVGAGHGDDAAGTDLKKRLHLAGGLRPGGTQPAEAPGSPGACPGVRKTTSARTPSDTPRRRAAPRPACSSSSTSASSFSRGVLSQASTWMPRASSMRMSGRLLTPMPSTATRFYPKANQNTDQTRLCSYSNASLNKIPASYYIRMGKKLQSV